MFPPQMNRLRVYLRLDQNQILKGPCYSWYGPNLSAIAVFRSAQINHTKGEMFAMHTTMIILQQLYSVDKLFGIGTQQVCFSYFPAVQSL